jgi:hypothetical protein
MTHHLMTQAEFSRYLFIGHAVAQAPGFGAGELSDFPRPATGRGHGNILFQVREGSAGAQRERPDSLSA